MNCVLLCVNDFYIKIIKIFIQQFYTGYTWHANITQTTSNSYNGTLLSSYSYSFNTATGQMSIQNVTFDAPGLAIMTITVYTVPSKFSVTTGNILGIIYSTQQVSVTITTTRTITVKFDLDYNTYGTDEFKGMFYAYFSNLYQNVRIYDITISQGMFIHQVVVLCHQLQYSPILECFIVEPIYLFLFIYLFLS